MNTLDRYLIRETLPPFFLALAVFTFILVISPVLEYAELLLVKGVPAGTVAFLLLTLLPQALGATIPIAMLTGLLMAFGRLSADREGVALLACGVSPLRLLRPVLALALIVGGIDLYVMIEAIPNANQRFREITFQYLAQQGEADIKARVFYEGFPGKVLFIQDIPPDGLWSEVMLADTSDPGRPVVTFGRTGRLVTSRELKEVNLYLDDYTQYRPPARSETGYERTEGTETLRIQIPAESVFGSGSLSLSRGLAEKTIADLKADWASRVQAGLSPHNEIMYIHQKFSFPVACLIFGPIALALGLHTRREGKLAGMTLGLAVVFVYYGLLVQAEASTKGGYFPAAWARWAPNFVIGLAGVVALWLKSRSAGRQVNLTPPAFLRSWRRDRAHDDTAPRRHGATRQAASALVLRLPEFRLPRPRILDLYVSSRYLRLVALTFVALLGLAYLGAFLDRSEKLFKGQADLAMLLEFLWYYTPELLTYVVPLATLVAVLGTVGGFAKTGELTVMRACGVSLYRLALPLVLMAVAWSGFLFFLEERVLARANQRAEALDDTIRGNPPHTVNVVANQHWLAGPDGRVYYYIAYDQTRTTLMGLSVFDTVRDPYRLSGHTFAQTAVHTEDGWLARDGWEQRFGPGGEVTRESFDGRTLSLAEPGDFASAQVDAKTMTISELRSYLARLDGSGFSLTDQRMELQKKLAFPAVTLVMTLIAVPFGVTTGRRGALYGIGLAIALAFSYFLLLAFFSAAGRAAVLPPVVAAWAANVFFLLAAGYMTLTVRT